MLVIMSPSKTQNFDGAKESPIQLSEKTAVLLNHLKCLDPDALGRLMKIKGKLLEKTYDIYQDSNFPVKEAIKAYDGVAFDSFDLESYSMEQIEYMNRHLRILSALYGVLKPQDLIRPYRLDLTMKPLDLNLYDYWQELIKEEFEKTPVIISLASNEFERLLIAYRFKIVQIVFKEKDTLKTVAFKSKQARGAMVNFMIKHQISDVESLKNFDELGYKWSESNSSANHLCFLRG